MPLPSFEEPSTLQMCIRDSSFGLELMAEIEADAVAAVIFVGEPSALVDGTVLKTVIGLGSVSYTHLEMQACLDDFGIVEYHQASRWQILRP